MADLQALADAVINGNRDATAKLTQEAVDGGTPVGDILNQGLIAGMNVVGDRFKKNEFYVPEVLIAARAMHSGMDIIKPLIAEAGIEAKGKVAIGTVKGDLHDIGKNLVAMMLEGGGYEVIDLEVDVAPEKFLAAVQDQGAQIIALSALLTTTMPAMKDTIDALAAAGLRGKAKVMIGGAPVTQNYADEIGADGYAPDAASAVDKAADLLA
jgi:5-methyltetrahydrofolate--homocysteine methyltransferase